MSRHGEFTKVAFLRMAKRKVKAPEKAVCGSKRKNGKPCQRPAGWGTDHAGFGHCKLHFGRAPNHRKHAAKLEVEEYIAQIQPIQVSPGQSLQGSVALSAGFLTWLKGKFEELIEGKNSLKEYSDVDRYWLKYLGETIERNARVAKLAADAGTQERMVKLSEDTAARHMAIIEAVAEEINLTKEQKKALGPAFRNQLALLEGTATESDNGGNNGDGSN